MKFSTGYENRKARVEMLPLIDVVFLLLVFFVYAMLSMVVHRGIKVALPEVGQAEVNRDDYLAITLTAENLILLNDQPVALNELAPRIRALRAGAAADMPVFIQGDRTADLGVAVQILSNLRAAGIEEVSFACETQAPTP